MEYSSLLLLLSQVYDMGKDYLIMASSIVNGDLYTNYDETSDYPYAFQQVKQSNVSYDT